MSKPRYLGDAVYVEIDEDRGMIKLTTTDPKQPDNVIYLERGVDTALVQYIKDYYVSLRKGARDDPVSI